MAGDARQRLATLPEKFGGRRLVHALLWGTIARIGGGTWASRTDFLSAGFRGRADLEVALLLVVTVSTTNHPKVLKWSFKTPFLRPSRALPKNNSKLAFFYLALGFDTMSKARRKNWWKEFLIFFSDPL